MNQSTLAKCLKGITLLMGIVGIVFFAGIVPAIIKYFGLEFPEYQFLVTPYIIAVGIGAIPIYSAMLLFWRICSRIAENNSFCRENTKALVIIGWLAIIDTVYCLIATAVLMMLNAINAAGIIIALGIIVIGAGTAMAAFVLSHLVEKALLIQEENELTV